MAQSTTTTITTTIASEILSQALAALRPRAPVVLNAFNQVSIDGANSLVYKIPRQVLMAEAAAVSEGSDASTISDFEYTTAVSVTPATYAIRGDLTERAIRRGPGAPLANQVFDAMQAGDMGPIMPALMPYVELLGQRLWAKAEKSAAAALASASGSVGSTTVDLTIANLLSAIYTLEANSPSHNDFAFYLCAIQLADLRAALMAGTGAALSTVLNSQVDASAANFNADIANNGFKGSFLGLPVFQIDPLSQDTANSGADVVGALIARGSGDPVMGQRGASVFVEGYAPRIMFDVDMSAGNVELIGKHEWAVAEHTDGHYVKIVTDL